MDPFYGPQTGTRPCLFILGTHRTNWAWNGRACGPLFLSARTLAARRGPFPRATVPVYIDSGGFTEISKYGEWRTGPREYAGLVRRAIEGLGTVAWAAIQDWMCEPGMLKKTGLTVAEHQQRTIRSYKELRGLDPAVRWLPVVQGWALRDYLDHLDQWAAAGVDLMAHGAVGVGSVCRRGQTDEIVSIVRALSGRGLRLHGFGIKAAALRATGQWLSSADSMAWSLRGRNLSLREGAADHDGRNLANSQPWAEQWRSRMNTEALGHPARAGQKNMWDAIPGWRPLPGSP